MEITEQIWKGIVVRCKCDTSFFVNAYEPLVKCEHCGHEDATLSLLAAWFGLGQHMLEKKLGPIAA